jgi:hypothetical protein
LRGAIVGAVGVARAYAAGGNAAAAASAAAASSVTSAAATATATVRVDGRHVITDVLCRGTTRHDHQHHTE